MTHDEWCKKLQCSRPDCVMCRKAWSAAQQTTADNNAMDATCDTIECPDCGAEFSVGCECPICKGHWLRHKQHQ